MNLLRSPRRLRLVPPVWASGLLLLAAHLLFFTWHTDRAARAFDGCVVPPNTIPGLAEPRFFLDNDSYAWMVHTRDLMASGGGRIRHTFMDNAPYGREMHWSHLLIWTLRGMARVIGAATGWPAARAVELAGVWAMPLCQFLFLSIAFLTLSRKFGWVPAGLFCGLSLALPGIVWGFHPLRPDHHGLQLCATLFAFACLQLGGMGWTINVPPRPVHAASSAFRPLALPTPPEARRWFMASGFFGGLALWFGATVWLFSLALIALAAVVVLPAIFRSPKTNAEYRPDLWRLWAFSGVATAIVFYLVEYAPRHFSMRLEVNHPLYWICWLGVAESLRFAGGSPSLRFWKNKRPADWVLAASGVLAASALPLLVLFGPAQWHQLNQPLLQRLHAGFIDEFQSAWPAIRSQPFAFFFSNTGILTIQVLVLAGTLIRSWNRPQPTEALVRAALAWAVLFFLLTLFQLRWGYFFAGALVWLGVLSLPFWIGPPRGSRRLVHFAAAVLLVNAILADAARLRMENAAACARRLPPEWLRASLSKRVALQWGLAAGTNRWCMVGMATDAPMLNYFAGIQTLASYYWENAAGWQAETDFFADGLGEQDALRIARERGLTHAFANPGDTLPLLYTTLKTGRDPSSACRQSLAGRLAFPKDAQLPDWIQLDAPLTAIADRQFVLRTPSGLIGQSAASLVFRLRPDDGAPKTSAEPPVEQP